MKCKEIATICLMFAVFSAAQAANLAEVWTSEALKAGRISLERGKRYICTDNFTLPSGTELAFAPGASIALSADAKLTINGTISAPAEQIFSGIGQVAGAPQNTLILPEWFGARSDGTSDSTAALQQAADLAMHSPHRTLFIGPGRYRFNGEIAIRCNVVCNGVLVKSITIDESQNEVGSSTYMPNYTPTTEARIVIERDAEPLELSPKSFAGITAGSFKLPSGGEAELADGSGSIRLAAGGTLILNSSDFFISRRNNKGDEYYSCCDVVEIASPYGDVVPEFCFSYPDRTDSPAWDPEKVYAKGDCVKVDDSIYKASFISGPGTVFHDPYRGESAIGSHSPAEGVRAPLSYPNGDTDTIQLWVPIDYKVRYVPPEPPLVIQGLNIEIDSSTPDSRMKPLKDGTLLCRRSNVTFNHLRLVVLDRTLMVRNLYSTGECVNVVHNQSLFSGATCPGYGYNILHGNVALHTYNQCTSVNARDGMAGRHGKQILLSGGVYNRIDDHYGMNYTLRDLTVTARSVMVPGYCTPECDIQEWGFVPCAAIAFAGGDITIENCRFLDCDTVLEIRSDVADFFGQVTMRDCTIRADRDVTVFTQWLPAKDFDYLFKLRAPERILLENISINAPYRLGLYLQSPPETYPMTLNGVGPLGNLKVGNTDLKCYDCSFVDTDFQLDKDCKFTARDCTFSGNCQNLPEGSR